MKKCILVSSFFMFSMASAAENLYCTFTEPFISVTLDGTTKNIEKVGPEDWNELTGQFDPKSLGTGSLVRIGNLEDYPSQYELRTDKGEVIMKLAFNSAGSDGMSDNTYPISAEFSAVSGLFGGCYTDSAKPWNSYDIETSLELIQ